MIPCFNNVGDKLRETLPRIEERKKKSARNRVNLMQRKNVIVRIGELSFH